MSTEFDDERAVSALADEALVAAIGARQPVYGQAAAVKELARRRFPRASPVLAAVMLDPGAPGAMRAAAAVALGRQVVPEHQRALALALRADEEGVIRRAAEALGRIGDRDALPALRAVPAPADPAARRALAFARSLLAYRLGLDDELLKPPDDGSSAAPVGEGAAALRPEPIGKDLGKRVAADLERELPAISMSVDGGVRFDCAGELLVAVPNAFLPAVPTSAFVAALVLKHWQAVDRFSPHLFLLSHPTGSGSLALFGVRPDGTMTHTGAIRVSGGALDFRLEALDTPYSPPVAFEGRLIPAGPRLDLTKALVGPVPSGQHRARVPRKAD